MAQAESDYQELDRSITALANLDALSPDAVANARAEVYLAAAKSADASVGRLLDVAEKLIELVPEIVERKSEASIRQADDLLDAVNVCRRRILSDRRLTNELKERADQLTEEGKEMRELVAQFSRAAEARQAVEGGTGTPAQQKLLGLWLLQRGEYEKALPYIRKSSDSSLVEIAEEPPESASDLLTLADAVEAESKKAKYSKRSESALLDYALHLRQLALAKSDGTLDRTTRTQVARSVNGPAEQIEWRRTPKGKWVKLTDIYSLDTLRQLASSARAGQWKVLDNGTILTTQPERSMMELPVNIDSSYAVRFICRRTTGDSVNVNLPLGDRSVLLTLGAYVGRYSGLQLVDGKRVNSSENGAAIKRKEFTMPRGVPVRVEIHVQLLPAASQSSKQKKLTGGDDWTTISILLDGRVVRRVSAASSRFAMDPTFQLSQDVLGLSAHALVAYSNIELMRL